MKHPIELHTSVRWQGSVARVIGKTLYGHPQKVDLEPLDADLQLFSGQTVRNVPIGELE